MNTITTGTPNTRTSHSPALARMGVAIAVIVPVAIVCAGIIVRHWDAIYWGAAIGWGVLAAFLMACFSWALGAIGLTRSDEAELLGSMFAQPHSSRAQFLGFMIHLLDGALIAVAFAFACRLLRVPIDAASGAVWGVFTWILAMFMMTNIGGVHPAIRRGEEEDPGTAGLNFGGFTPVANLMSHLVFGVILGALYFHSVH